MPRHQPDDPRARRLRAPSWLPAPVWLLGWISLLTDTASEAVYPLLPVFLTVVLGAGPLALGVIEGVAEATSASLKIVVGRVSDRQGRRRVWVVGGYALSSLVRPLTALVGTWGHVLAVRFADRVGKGVRSAPRDAILAHVAPAEARGRVFGFHRAMDHAGAVAGPLLAAAFLWAWPGQYRWLFALTLVPGILVVALVVRLPADVAPVDTARTAERRNGSRDGAAEAPGGVPIATGGYARIPGSLWRAFAVFGIFSLGNSTDAYLLLRLGHVLPSVAFVPVAWAALHVVKAVTSLLGGAAADRFGRKLSITAGWAIYAGVYAVFASTTSAALLVVVFLAYGGYFGMTEGAEKALVADLAPATLRGTAFGIYNAVIGLGALAASILFGLVWEWHGPGVAFAMGASLAAVATVLLWTSVPSVRVSAGGR